MNTIKTPTKQAMLFIALFLMTLTSETIFPQNVAGQGTTKTEIQIYSGIVPSGALPQTKLLNIMSNIWAKTPEKADWEYVPNGSSVNITSIFKSEGIGRALRYSFSVTSDTEFMLSDVEWRMIDSMSYDSGVFSRNLNGFGVALSYGPDKLPHTSDDIFYTSGYPLANEFYLIGNGETIDISGQTLEEAVNSWKAFCPWEVTIQYSLNDVTASANITYVVPEPQTALLITIAGVVSLVYFLYRKKR